MQLPQNMKFFVGVNCICWYKLVQNLGKCNHILADVWVLHVCRAVLQTFCGHVRMTKLGAYSHICGLRARPPDILLLNRIKQRTFTVILVGFSLSLLASKPAVCLGNQLTQNPVSITHAERLLSTVNEPYQI